MALQSVKSGVWWFLQPLYSTFSVLYCSSFLNNFQSNCRLSLSLVWCCKTKFVNTAGRGYFLMVLIWGCIANKVTISKFDYFLYTCSYSNSVLLTWLYNYADSIHCLDVTYWNDVDDQMCCLYILYILYILFI